MSALQTVVVELRDGATQDELQAAIERAGCVKQVVFLGPDNLVQVDYEDESRTFTCAGCDVQVVVAVDSDFQGSLCEDCDLVATALISDDAERAAEAVGAARVGALRDRAQAARCAVCDGEPGIGPDTVLLVWHCEDALLCNGCAEGRLAAEQAAAAAARPVYR